MGIDTSKNLDELNSFLRQHDAVDFRTTDLLNTTSLDAFTWPNDDALKSDLLTQLKAYQRLLRVLPTNDDIPTSDIALQLLMQGIDSSLQITQMGKAKFLASTTGIFGDFKNVATQVYKRALVSRNLVAAKYIRQLQHREPHARAVGLNL